MTIVHSLIATRYFFYRSRSAVRGDKLTRKKRVDTQNPTKPEIMIGTNGDDNAVSGCFAEFVKYSDCEIQKPMNPQPVPTEICKEKINRRTWIGKYERLATRFYSDQKSEHIPQLFLYTVLCHKDRTANHCVCVPSPRKVRNHPRHSRWRSSCSFHRTTSLPSKTSRSTKFHVLRLQQTWHGSPVCKTQ